MTVEKAESQKLISMSLGKIATSRSQRGGINLHKNLLVASVLHKARTVFIMENYSHVIARKAQHQKKLSSKNVPDVRKPDTTISSSTREAVPRVGGGIDESNQASECKVNRESIVTVHVACSSEDIDNSPENICSGKENNPPVCNSSEDMDTDADDVIERVEDVASSDRLDEVTEVNGENNRTSSDCDSINNNDVSINSDSKSSCDNKTDSNIVSPLRDSSSSKQCLNVSSNNKSSPNRKRSRFQKSLTIAAKKIKYDSDSEYDSDAESSVSSTHLKSSSPQITNLVTIFNSGFNGLCNKNTGSSCNSVSNTHCSSELKDNSIDQLSLVPVIALTV